MNLKLLYLSFEFINYIYNHYKS